MSLLSRDTACQVHRSTATRQDLQAHSQHAPAVRADNSTAETVATVRLRYSTNLIDSLVFAARRYASAVLAVIVCLSVRPSVCLSVHPSVCLSQVGVVQRWLNLGSD